MNKFVVELTPNTTTPEVFETRAANVAKFSVYTPENRKRIEGKAAVVLIDLSPEAMIGLGTSLIRWAHETGPRTQTVWELNPIEQGLLSSCLGVYVHPTSCKVVISRTDLGTVDALAKEQGW